MCIGPGSFIIVSFNQWHSRCKRRWWPLQANELRPVMSFRVKRYYTFTGHKSWKNGIPTWSGAGEKNEGLWVNADRKNERDARRVPRTATRISGLETLRGEKRINLRNKKDYSYRLVLKINNYERVACIARVSARTRSKSCNKSDFFKNKIAR